MRRKRDRSVERIVPLISDVASVSAGGQEGTNTGPSPASQNTRRFLKHREEKMCTVSSLSSAQKSHVRAT